MFTRSTPILPAGSEALSRATASSNVRPPGRPQSTGTRTVPHSVSRLPSHAAQVISEKVVGKHINAIFTKLDLPPSATDDHRRVRAVLTYLRWDGPEG